MPNPFVDAYAPSRPSPFEGLFDQPPVASQLATPFDEPVEAPPPAPALAPPAPIGAPALRAVETAQPQARGPNFVQMALPILASLIAGGKDPRAIGAGMAAWMRGADLKRQERESFLEREERKRQEQAEFYSRALTAAQQFDDPVAFEQWKDAIAPVAELHGINVDAIPFSNEKLRTREKREAQELLERLDRQHPSGNYTADWKGRRVTRAELAAFAGQAAYDADGTPLPPAAATSAKTTQVRTRNADGTETIQIVEDKPGQTFTSAAEPVTDQEWVVRNGQVTPIAKGTRKPGDRPYQPPPNAAPPQGSPQWVIGSDGQQHYRVPQAGDRRHDPVAERQTNAPDPESARQATQTALDLVTRLETHAGIGAATGAYEMRGFTQGAVDFNAIRDQLVAALALPNLGALKGPMSDKDVIFVKQLATRLANTRLSESETRKALAEAKLFLQTKLGGGPAPSPSPTPTPPPGRQAAGAADPLGIR